MINALDIGIIVIGLVIIVRGYIRGFVKEVVSLGGLILAVAVGVRFQVQAQQLLNESFGPSNYNFVLAFILLFISTMVVTALLGGLLARVVAASPLNSLNRGLGLFTGLIKAALVTVVCVFLLTFLLSAENSLMKKSIIAPWAIEAAAVGIDHLPPGIVKKIEEARKSYRSVPIRRLQ